jgi:hypothetical protein
MIRRIERDEAYMKALARAEENRQRVVQQLQGKVTNPATLAALNEPITSLIKPPVKLEGITEGDKQVFLWYNEFICAALTSSER